MRLIKCDLCGRDITHDTFFKLHGTKRRYNEEIEVPAFKPKELCAWCLENILKELNKTSG